MNDIPAGWVAVIVALVTFAGLAFPLIFGRNKPGIAPTSTTPPAPTGGAPHFVNVGATLVALSHTIDEQAERIGRLEKHETEYQARINVLEQWGRYSTDPPPRDPPAWVRPSDSGA